MLYLLGPGLRTFPQVLNVPLSKDTSTDKAFFYVPIQAVKA